MKRFIVSVLSFCLIACLIIGLLLIWFKDHNCNPCGKDWRNDTSGPTLIHPFNENYDGACSIKIDRDGNVLFKPIDSEQIKGKLTTYSERFGSGTDIVIEFEDGTTSRGGCYWYCGARRLHFEYKSEYYWFSNKSGESKEEIEEQRSELIAFMRSIYDGGAFPTKDEIKENNAYKTFTLYKPGDSAHGGPSSYFIAQKVTIDKLDLENMTVTMNRDGEMVQEAIDDSFAVICVSNGEFKEITADESISGDCLVVTHCSREGIRFIYFFED